MRRFEPCPWPWEYDKEEITPLGDLTGGPSLDETLHHAAENSDRIVWDEQAGEYTILQESPPAPSELETEVQARYESWLAGERELSPAEQQRMVAKWEKDMAKINAAIERENNNAHRLKNHLPNRGDIEHELAKHPSLPVKLDHLGRKVVLVIDDDNPNAALFRRTLGKESGDERWVTHPDQLAVLAASGHPKQDGFQPIATAVSVVSDRFALAAGGLPRNLRRGISLCGK